MNGMKTRKNDVIRSVILTCIMVVTLPVLYGQGITFSTYYHQRQSLFEVLPVTEGAIVFVGNSITDGCEWSEFFPEFVVLNRGISGDISEGVLYRLPSIIELKPTKVFLKIGTNDLARNIPAQTLFDNICLIIDQIREQSPETEIFIQSILPVNDAFGMFSGHTSRTPEIKWVNSQLQEWAENRTKVTYIDLFNRFRNEDNDLMNIKYTNDGLHLTGEGYRLWVEILNPYIRRK